MTEELNKKCINCGAETVREDSEFCWNCGFPINSNFCTNDMCDLNNGQEIPLPEYAMFCDLCGSESTYNERGIINTDFQNLDKVPHRNENKILQSDDD